VDPLTLTIILSLFNPYINITSQKFSSTPFHLLFIILYSSPSCGSTLVLLGYLFLRHSCTWNKTLIFWSCQLDKNFFCQTYIEISKISNEILVESLLYQEVSSYRQSSYTHLILISQSHHNHVEVQMNNLFIDISITSHLLIFFHI
jgi:hypothetical protein